MLVTSDRFKKLAKSWVRPLTWRVAMAWDKTRNENISWGVYDQSTYGGGDLYASDIASQPPVQIWDTYAYTDISNRIKSIAVNRSVEFPYSVQSAIADFELANHDGYFVPYSNSPIAKYIKPNIPTRAWLGFGEENVPQFVGLTNMLPDAEPGKAEASVSAFDFLNWALSQPLPELPPMAYKKTDYILTEIFKGLGFAPHQFTFSGATNIVPIFFPNKNDSLADIVKKLVQAENGRLWQDEEGLIRFKGRGSDVAEDIHYRLDDDNVISITPSKSSGIVNHVKIKTPIRVIAPYQMVAEKTSSGKNTDNLWVVKRGLPIVREVSLSDPCADLIEPKLGENADVSWFTAKTANGVEVDRGVKCSLKLTPSKAILTFTSDLFYPVEIDRVFLWGEPSKQIDELDYEAFDDNWSDDEDYLLEINDNPFFGNYENARAFTQSVFRGYATYSPMLELEVKGSPAMQIGDSIKLDTRLASGVYQIIAISQKLSDSKLTTKLKVRKTKVYMFAQYDRSVYNGEEVYAF